MTAPDAKRPSVTEGKAAQSLPSVVGYALDVHLMRAHGHPPRLVQFEGCTFCAQLADVRAAMGYPPLPVAKGSSAPSQGVTE